MQYIAPLAKLIEHFRALPGIGNKTAVRLAYHVLDMDAEQAKKLAEAIIEAKEKIGYCNTCFNLSDQNPCVICAAEERDHSVICVVEQPQDVAAMERMRDYRGVYHVLNGVISPSKGVMPETVTLYRDTCISFMNLGLTKSASEKELLSIIGRENTNEIFTSTSFSVLDLQSRDTRMYITVPKGYKGCQYIKPLVYNQYKGQEEVLFDAPLTYIINNATIDESGKILLYVEVLMKDGT